MMAGPVDLDEVRAVRAELAELAHHHPELLGASTPDEWERILMEDEMSKTNKTLQIAIRFEPELIARLDAYRSDIEAATGLRVSRAAAIRALVSKGLEGRAALSNS